ncbi:coat protein [Kudzu virus D]|nr:coat protein [Kudzu virus D]
MDETAEQRAARLKKEKEEADKKNKEASGGGNTGGNNAGSGGNNNKGGSGGNNKGSSRSSDRKSIFGTLTKAQIEKISFDPEGLSVMNTVQAERLLNILKKTHKVNAEQAMEALINLALYCHQNGSSPFMKAVGNSTISGCSLSDLIGCIREADCSLRQCNAYFANVVYDWSKENNVAPSNYRQDGFTEDTKFASFDFFHGVGHSAALVPEGGCKHVPTDKEIHAANVSRMRKITNANISKGNAILNIGEITGGREGSKSKMTLRNEFQTEI